MNHTIKNALNKYEIQEHNVEDQLIALYLISCIDKEVCTAMSRTINLRHYLKKLKGMGTCEVQYATA